MRKTRRIEVVKNLDDFKRRAEAARKTSEARTKKVQCRHVVNRDEVVRLRMIPGGGTIRCESCGAPLPITNNVRTMPDGSLL